MYEQYNPETTHRNTPKLKYFILIDKTKHLPKWNSQLAGNSNTGYAVLRVLCCNLYYLLTVLYVYYNNL